MKKAVSTQDAPQAVGPYAQGVEAGGFVFISGQIPLNPDGTPAAGGIAELTERCLKNIEGILKSAGLGLEDVVKTTVFLTDMSRFAEMNEAYGRFFKSPYPARATVEVRALPKGVPVEIEAIAVRR